MRGIFTRIDIWIQNEIWVYSYSYTVWKSLEILEQALEKQKIQPIDQIVCQIPEK